MLYQRNVVSRAWANSILRRMKFVKRKGTKSAKKVPADAPAQINKFHNRIYYTMKKYNIPNSMFVTFDESSSALVPASDWTLEEQGASQVGIGGLDDKRNVTLGLSFSATKILLTTQIIYEGKTDLKHMEEIWEDNDRVRLLAAMKFQEKTRQQLDVPPALVQLTPQEYIGATQMDTPYKWGGSTELEVAASWLRTPIKVYHFGNPKFPPKSWITYGSLTPTFHGHTLLLQWTNGDHYDYVSELV